MAQLISLVLAVFISALVPTLAFAGADSECDPVAPHFDETGGNSGVWVHNAQTLTNRGANQDGLTELANGNLPSLPAQGYSLMSGPVLGYADLDGNGVTDVIAQFDATGFTYAYLMESDSPDSDWLKIKAMGAIPGPPDVSAYSNLGFPDLNGDGKSDICYQANTGFTFCSTMDGLTVLGSGQIDGPFDSTYRTIGFPDLNGDGTQDQVVQYPPTGFTWAFLYEDDGGGFVQTIAVNGSGVVGTLGVAGYTTIGFPDLDGMNGADIVLQHTGGFTYAFLQDGIAATGQGAIDGLATGFGYSTMGFPDLDGDGNADHALANTSGFNYAFLYEPDGSGFVRTKLTNGQGAITPFPSSDYSFLGFPDFNCDAKLDFAFQASNGFTVGYLSGDSGFLDTATGPGGLLGPVGGESTLAWQASWGVIPAAP